MKTKTTIIILCLITQVLPIDGLRQLKNSLASSDSPLLMKVLELVDAATSNEHLLQVTLKLLGSLCACMRETLNVKEEYFNISKHSIDTKKIDSNEGKVFDLYIDIYNNSCFNLRQELSNRTHKLFFEEESALLNHTDCGKDEKTETYNKRSDSEESPTVKHSIPSKLEQILYKALIETKDLHDYRLRKYELFGKSSTSQVQSVLQHILIVILTLHPDKQEASGRKNYIDEKDLNTTLYEKSPIDVDIIDSKHDKNLKKKDKSIKTENLSECNLQSLYKFLTESDRDNLTKVFKFIRKSDTIKVYVEVNIKGNYTEFINICCENGTTISKCRKDFKNLSDAKLLDDSYINTITKIKRLVNQYENQLNATHHNTSTITVQDENKKEKIILESIKKEGVIDDDRINNKENDIQSDTKLKESSKLSEVTQAIVLLNDYVTKQTTKKYSQIYQTDSDGEGTDFSTTYKPIHINITSKTKGQEENYENEWTNLLQFNDSNKVINIGPNIPENGLKITTDWKKDITSNDTEKISSLGITFPKFQEKHEVEENLQQASTSRTDKENFINNSLMIISSTGNDPNTKWHTIDILQNTTVANKLNTVIPTVYEDGEFTKFSSPPLTTNTTLISDLGITQSSESNFDIKVNDTEITKTILMAQNTEETLQDSLRTIKLSMKNNTVLLTNLQTTEIFKEHFTTDLSTSQNTLPIQNKKEKKAKKKTKHKTIIPFRSLSTQYPMISETFYGGMQTESIPKQSVPVDSTTVIKNCTSKKLKNKTSKNTASKKVKADISKALPHEMTKQYEKITENVNKYGKNLFHISKTNTDIGSPVTKNISTIHETTITNSYQNIAKNTPLESMTAISSFDLQVMLNQPVENDIKKFDTVYKGSNVEPSSTVASHITTEGLNMHTVQKIRANFTENYISSTTTSNVPTQVMTKVNDDFIGESNSSSNYTNFGNTTNELIINGTDTVTSEMVTHQKDPKNETIKTISPKINKTGFENALLNEKTTMEYTKSTANVKELEENLALRGTKFLIIDENISSPSITPEIKNISEITKSTIETTTTTKLQNILKNTTLKSFTSISTFNLSRIHSQSMDNDLKGLDNIDRKNNIEPTSTVVSLVSSEESDVHTVLKMNVKNYTSTKEATFRYPTQDISKPDTDMSSTVHENLIGETKSSSNNTDDGTETVSYMNNDLSVNTESTTVTVEDTIPTILANNQSTDADMEDLNTIDSLTTVEPMSIGVPQVTIEEPNVHTERKIKMNITKKYAPEISSTDTTFRQSTQDFRKPNNEMNAENSDIFDNFTVDATQSSSHYINAVTKIEPMSTVVPLVSIEESDVYTVLKMNTNHYISSTKATFSYPTQDISKPDSDISSTVFENLIGETKSSSNNTNDGTETDSYMNHDLSVNTESTSVTVEDIISTSLPNNQSTDADMEDLNTIDTFANLEPMSIGVPQVTIEEPNVHTVRNIKMNITKNYAPEVSSTNTTFRQSTQDFRKPDNEMNAENSEIFDNFTVDNTQLSSHYTNAATKIEPMSTVVPLVSIEESDVHNVLKVNTNKYISFTEATFSYPTQDISKLDTDVSSTVLENLIGETKSISNNTNDGTEPVSYMNNDLFVNTESTSVTVEDIISTFLPNNQSTDADMEDLNTIDTLTKLEPMSIGVPQVTIEEPNVQTVRNIKMNITKNHTPEISSTYTTFEQSTQDFRKPDNEMNVENSDIFHNFTVDNNTQLSSHYANVITKIEPTSTVVFLVPNEEPTVNTVPKMETKNYISSPEATFSHSTQNMRPDTDINFETKSRSNNTYDATETDSYMKNGLSVNTESTTVTVEDIVLANNQLTDADKEDLNTIDTFKKVKPMSSGVSQVTIEEPNVHTMRKIKINITKNYPPEISSTDTTFRQSTQDFRKPDNEMNAENSDIFDNFTVDNTQLSSHYTNAATKIKPMSAVVPLVSIEESNVHTVLKVNTNNYISSTEATFSYPIQDISQRATDVSSTVLENLIDETKSSSNNTNDGTETVSYMNNDLSVNTESTSVTVEDIISTFLPNNQLTDADMEDLNTIDTFTKLEPMSIGVPQVTIEDPNMHTVRNIKMNITKNYASEISSTDTTFRQSTQDFRKPDNEMNTENSDIFDNFTVDNTQLSSYYTNAAAKTEPMSTVVLLVPIEESNVNFVQNMETKNYISSTEATFVHSALDMRPDTDMSFTVLDNLIDETKSTSNNTNADTETDSYMSNGLSVNTEGITLIVEDTVSTFVADIQSTDADLEDFNTIDSLTKVEPMGTDVPQVTLEKPLTAQKIKMNFTKYYVPGISSIETTFMQHTQDFKKPDNDINSKKLEILDNFTVGTQLNNSYINGVSETISYMATGLSVNTEKTAQVITVTKITVEDSMPTFSESTTDIEPTLETTYAVLSEMTTPQTKSKNKLVETTASEKSETGFDIIIPNETTTKKYAELTENVNEFGQSLIYHVTKANKNILTSTSKSPPSMPPFYNLSNDRATNMTQKLLTTIPILDIHTFDDDIEDFNTIDKVTKMESMSPIISHATIEEPDTHNVLKIVTKVARQYTPSTHTLDQTSQVLSKVDSGKKSLILTTGLSTTTEESAVNIEESITSISFRNTTDMEMNMKNTDVDPSEITTALYKERLENDTNLENIFLSKNISSTKSILKSENVKTYSPNYPQKETAQLHFSEVSSESNTEAALEAYTIQTSTDNNHPVTISIPKFTASSEDIKNTTSFRISISKMEDKQTVSDTTEITFTDQEYELTNYKPTVSQDQQPKKTSTTLQTESAKETNNSNLISISINANENVDLASDLKEIKFSNKSLTDKIPDIKNQTQKTSVHESEIEMTDNTFKIATTSVMEMISAENLQNKVKVPNNNDLNALLREKSVLYTPLDKDKSELTNTSLAKFSTLKQNLSLNINTSTEPVLKVIHDVSNALDNHYTSITTVSPPPYNSTSTKTTPNELAEFNREHVIIKVDTVAKNLLVIQNSKYADKEWNTIPESLTKRPSNNITDHTSISSLPSPDYFTTELNNTVVEEVTPLKIELDNNQTVVALTMPTFTMAINPIVKPVTAATIKTKYLEKKVLAKTKEKHHEDVFADATTIKSIPSNTFDAITLRNTSIYNEIEKYDTTLMQNVKTENMNNQSNVDDIEIKDEQIATKSTYIDSTSYEKIQKLDLNLMPTAINTLETFDDKNLSPFQTLSYRDIDNETMTTLSEPKIIKFENNRDVEKPKISTLFTKESIIPTYTVSTPVTYISTDIKQNAATNKQSKISNMHTEQILGNTYMETTHYALEAFKTTQSEASPNTALNSSIIGANEVTQIEDLEKHNVTLKSHSTVTKIPKSISIFTNANNYSGKIKAISEKTSKSKIKLKKPMSFELNIRVGVEANKDGIKFSILDEKESVMYHNASRVPTATCNHSNQSGNSAQDALLKSEIKFMNKTGINTPTLLESKDIVSKNNTSNRRSNVVNKEDLSRIAEILHKLSWTPPTKRPKISKRMKTRKSFVENTTIIINENINPLQTNITSSNVSATSPHKNFTKIKHKSIVPGALTEELAIPNIKSIYKEQIKKIKESLNKTENGNTTSEDIMKIYQAMISFPVTENITNSKLNISGVNNTSEKYDNQVNIKPGLTTLFRATNDSIKGKSRLNKDTISKSKLINKKINKVLKKILKGKKLSKYQMQIIKKKLLKMIITNQKNVTDIHKSQDSVKKKKNFNMTTDTIILNTTHNFTTKEAFNVTDMKNVESFVASSVINKKPDKKMDTTESKDKMTKTNVKPMVIKEIVNKTGEDIIHGARRFYSTLNSSATPQIEIGSFKLEPEITHILSTGTTNSFNKKFINITTSEVEPLIADKRFSGILQVLNEIDEDLAKLENKSDNETIATSRSVIFNSSHALMKTEVSKEIQSIFNSVYKFIEELKDVSEQKNYTSNLGYSDINSTTKNTNRRNSNSNMYTIRTDASNAVATTNTKSENSVNRNGSIYEIITEPNQVTSVFFASSTTHLLKINSENATLSEYNRDNEVLRYTDPMSNITSISFITQYPIEKTTEIPKFTQIHETQIMDPTNYNNTSTTNIAEQYWFINSLNATDDKSYNFTTTTHLPVNDDTVSKKAFMETSKPKQNNSAIELTFLGIDYHMNLTAIEDKFVSKSINNTIKNGVKNVNYETFVNKRMKSVTENTKNINDETLEATQNILPVTDDQFPKIYQDAFTYKHNTSSTQLLDENNTQSFYIVDKSATTTINNYNNVHVPLLSPIIQNVSNVLKNTKYNLFLKVHDGDKNIKVIDTPKSTHIKVTKLNAVNRSNVNVNPEVQKLLLISQNKESMGKHRTYRNNTKGKPYRSNYKSLFPNIESGNFKSKKSMDIYSSRLNRPYNSLTKSTAVTKNIKYNTYRPISKEELELLKLVRSPIFNTVLQKHNIKLYPQVTALYNLSKFDQVIQLENANRINKGLHLENRNLNQPIDIFKITHSSEMNRISRPILEININSPQIRASGNSPPMIEINGNPLPIEINRNLVSMDMNRSSMLMDKNQILVPMEMKSIAAPVNINRNSISMDMNRVSVPIDINKNSVPINMDRNSVPMDMNRNLMPMNINRNFVPMDINTNSMPMDINRNLVSMDMNSNSRPLDLNRNLVPTVMNRNYVLMHMNNNAKPTDMNKNLVPADINSNLVPMNMNRNSVPMNIDTNLVPMDINRNSRPLEMNRNLVPTDMNRNVVPMDLNSKSVPINMNNDAKPIDMDRNSVTMDMNKDLIVKDMNTNSVLMDMNGNSMPIDMDRNSAPMNLNKNFMPMEVNRNLVPTAMSSNSAPIGMNRNSAQLEMPRTSLSMEINRNSIPLAINSNPITTVKNRNFAAMDMSKHSAPININNILTPVEMNENEASIDINRNSALLENIQNSVQMDQNQNSAPMEINNNMTPMSLIKKTAPIEMKRNLVPMEMNNNSVQTEMNENSSLMEINTTSAPMGMDRNSELLGINRNSAPIEITRNLDQMQMNNNSTLMQPNRKSMQMEINKNSMPMYTNRNAVPLEPDGNTVPNNDSVPLGINENTVPIEIDRNLVPTDNDRNPVPMKNKILMPMEVNTNSLVAVSNLEPSDINKNREPMNINSTGFKNSVPLGVNKSSVHTEFNTKLEPVVIRENSSPQKNIRLSIPEETDKKSGQMKINRSSSRTIEINKSIPTAVYSPSSIINNNNSPSLTDNNRKILLDNNNDPSMNYKPRISSFMFNDNGNQLATFNDDSKLPQINYSSQKPPSINETHKQMSFMADNNVYARPVMGNNKKSSVVIINRRNGHVIHSNNKKSRSMEINKKPLRRAPNQIKTHLMTTPSTTGIKQLEPIAAAKKKMVPMKEIKRKPLLTFENNKKPLSMAGKNRRANGPLQINRNTHSNFVMKNYKKIGSEKGTLFGSFEKRNSYAVKEPKAQRRHVKTELRQIKIGSRSKAVMTMHTQDFLSQHRTPRSFLQKITKPYLMFRKPERSVKKTILRPKFKKSADRTTKRLDNRLKPKPVFIRNDMLQRDLISNQLMGTVNRRERINNMLNIPMWQSTVRPTLFQDSDDEMNFMFTDYMRMTRRPGFNNMARVDSNYFGDNYSPSPFYRKHHNIEQSTTAATRRPRGGRTIFFLSPTAGYGDYSYD